MSGLIVEIQRNALDDALPIASLLRRMKLAASKLDLGELEGWVDSELNGYTGQLPPYRLCLGQPAAFDPWVGWYPMLVANDEFMSMISEARVRQSVSSIEETLRQSSEGHFSLPVDPRFVVKLHEILPGFDATQMNIQVARGSLVTILERVRGLALDWAIKMEKSGVKGDGLSFTPTEVREAHNAMPTIHIGQIGQLTGNIGSNNTTGTISSTGISVSVVSDVISKLRANLPALKGEGVDTDELSKVLSQIEDEVAKPSPASSKVWSLLTDARTILTGAAGSMLAEGAIALITNALS